jgi:hypothetical protein
MLMSTFTHDDVMLLMGRWLLLWMDGWNRYGRVKTRLFFRCFLAGHDDDDKTLNKNGCLLEVVCCKA